MSKQADEVKGLYFPVLDHGFVSLVDYMGGDEDIINAARVSYGAGTKKISDSNTLIRYLLRHRHSTPYEMVELKFHMKLPIFVARQLIRHRTASVNEYSGRYSLMPMLFYKPDEKNFALQSKSNRQGRGEKADHELYKRAIGSWEGGRELTAANYENLASEGVARELARIDLPLSMYTEWYWKIDLHNLLHFLSLRADSHAQWEIQQYANPMVGLANCVAPLAVAAWFDYRYSSMSLSYQETCLLHEILHKRIDDEALLEYVATKKMGMSSRELDEFKGKKAILDNGPNRDLDRFRILPENAKPAEFFLNEAREATPKIDKQE